MRTKTNPEKIKNDDEKHLPKVIAPHKKALGDHLYMGIREVFAKNLFVKKNLPTCVVDKLEEKKNETTFCLEGCKKEKKKKPKTQHNEKDKGVNKKDMIRIENTTVTLRKEVEIICKACNWIQFMAPAFFTSDKIE